MKAVQKGTNERTSACTEPTVTSLTLGLDSQPALWITLLFCLFWFALGCSGGLVEKSHKHNRLVTPSAANPEMRWLTAERRESWSSQKERERFFHSWDPFQCPNYHYHCPTAPAVSSPQPSQQLINGSSHFSDSLVYFLKSLYKTTWLASLSPFDKLGQREVK